MKILILSDYTDFGGVAVSSVALQKCLSTAEVDVELYPIFDSPYGFKFKLLSLIKALIFVFSCRADKVILKHFDAILIGFVLRPFFRRGYFVNVVHTDLYGYYCGVSVIKKFVLRLIFKSINKNLIIFDSKEAELKAKNYFNLSNTNSIYNVIENPTILAQKTRHEEFIFGSVARLHPAKNIDLLILIFNEFWIKHKRTKLYIFGGGSELDSLKEYASGMPCSQAIEFKGYQPTDEIYGQIDALVGFSSMEGFGLVILEALSRNIPVLFSDCSCGPREILQPSSDPCIKTSSYEVAEGGVLFSLPEFIRPYATNMSGSDQIALDALSLFYSQAVNSEILETVDLKRFSCSVIRRQWMDCLSR